MYTQLTHSIYWGLSDGFEDKKLGHTAVVQMSHMLDAIADYVAAVNKQSSAESAAYFDPIKDEYLKYLRVLRKNRRTKYDFAVACIKEVNASCDEAGCKRFYPGDIENSSEVDEFLIAIAREMLSRYTPLGEDKHETE